MGFSLETRRYPMYWSPVNRTTASQSCHSKGEHYVYVEDVAGLPHSVLRFAVRAMKPNLN